MNLKSKLLGIAIIFLLLSGGNATAQTGKIVVEVSNLRNASGKVLAALYKSEKGFMKDEKLAIATAQVTLSGKQVQIVFDVPYGEYAFSLLHDENGNGKMDTNMLGIPKEGYAASNNAKNSLGAPKYPDAKFKLDKPEIRQQVQMIYW
jgi:uncharacterized protein (DUF2141 family)